MLVIVAVNFLASSFHSRLDLTKEKRYTISNVTKELLKNLDEPVTIDVFVHKKDLSAEAKKLRNSINEFLMECKEYGKNNLQLNRCIAFYLVTR